jgi:hypothetical protein
MDLILSFIFLLVIIFLSIYFYYYLGSVNKDQFIGVLVDELDVRRKKGGSKKTGLKDLKKSPRSKAEARIIAQLEKITNTKFPTAYPAWLVWKGAQLELDGYNGVIAIEFSGPLHTKWKPSFEPYGAYYRRLVKDVVKRRLCEKNGVPLIVVDYTMPEQHWANYLKSRLADIGYMNVSHNYIPAQKVIPFRNMQLEAELGLVEMIDAEKA